MLRIHVDGLFRRDREHRRIECPRRAGKEASVQRLRRRRGAVRAETAGRHRPGRFPPVQHHRTERIERMGGSGNSHAMPTMEISPVPVHAASLLDSVVALCFSVPFCASICCSMHCTERQAPSKSPAGPNRPRRRYARAGWPDRRRCRRRPVAESRPPSGSRDARSARPRRTAPCSSRGCPIRGCAACRRARTSAAASGRAPPSGARPGCGTGPTASRGALLPCRSGWPSTDATVHRCRTSPCHTVQAGWDGPRNELPGPSRLRRCLAACRRSTTGPRPRSMPTRSGTGRRHRGWRSRPAAGSGQAPGAGAAAARAPRARTGRRRGAAPQSTRLRSSRRWRRRAAPTSRRARDPRPRRRPVRAPRAPRSRSASACRRPAGRTDARAGAGRAASRSIPRHSDSRS